MAASSRSGGASKKKGSARRAGARDFEALRRRRMRAADRFERGERQADVARAERVSAETVSEWYRLWSQGGREALEGAGRAGRRPRLSDEQLAEVVAALRQGPRACGFATDLWTLARVADVIEDTTGVRYSQTQTWTILRERLGWSRQRPARRALERDDAAIANWVEKEWPRIKKGRGDAELGSSSRTSQGSRCSPR